MRKTLLAAIAAGPVIALAVPGAALADSGGHHHHHGHGNKEQTCFIVPVSGTGYQAIEGQGGYGGGYGQSEPVTVNADALVCEFGGQLQVVKFKNVQVSEQEAHENGDTGQGM